jgi:hypothetical protein
MFEFTTWHASLLDFFISLRHYTVIGKQLLLSNDRNRVRGVVLGLSQDGANTNLFENFRENSLKRDLSNNTTVNPPLFSLVNTFNSTQLSQLLYCNLFLQIWIRLHPGGRWSHFTDPVHTQLRHHHQVCFLI